MAKRKMVKRRSLGVRFVEGFARDGCSKPSIS
jgi:hypothetical protein